MRRKCFLTFWSAIIFEIQLLFMIFSLKQTKRFFNSSHASYFHFQVKNECLDLVGNYSPLSLNDLVEDHLNDLVEDRL